MNNSILMNNLVKQITSCTKCNLCITRKKSVPGCGNINSKIVFLAEAPGKNEDTVGLPFVGKAGQLLDTVLKNNGLTRKSIYITNIVKCRPPNNRIPKKSEIEKCKQYLKTELNLIKPKLICIFGNTAYKSILGGNNIIQNNGKFLHFQNQLYFLSIHPASVLYNRKLLSILNNNIYNIAKFYNNSKYIV